MRLTNAGSVTASERRLDADTERGVELLEPRERLVPVEQVVAHLEREAARDWGREREARVALAVSRVAQVQEVGAARLEPRLLREVVAVERSKAGGSELFVDVQCRPPLVHAHAGLEVELVRLRDDRLPRQAHALVELPRDPREGVPLPRRQPVGGEPRMERAVRAQ